MPITAYHSLTMTTPDNPAFENRPSHWNSAHIVTANMVGSEVSGAFSNAGNVTFGFDGTYITATANAAGAGDGFNRISAGTQLAGTNNTISFADGGGVTFGMSNSSIITAAVATSYAGSNHSHGDPTLALTNLSGTTASNSAGFTLSLSAGNYLTTAAATNHSHGNPTLALTNLSGTTASASNGLTLSLSAAAPQTGISGIIASDATYTSGTISFSNQNGVTIGSSVNGASQYVRLSVATSYAASNHSHGNPTLALTNLSGTTASASNGLTLSLSAAAPGAATQTVSFVGNTTVNSSGTWPGAMSIRAYGVLSAGTSNGSLLLSTPDPVDFTYLSVGNSNIGNTAGDTGVFSQRMVLVGSNNITLSGSSNGGSVTLSIIGAAGGAGASFGVSNVGNTSGNTGLTGTNLVLSGGNGVTLSQSTHANGATVGFSVATSYAASNHSHGNPTLALTNLTGTTASASNGLTISLSAAAPGGGGYSAGVSNIGNTAGNTGLTGSNIVFSGGNGVSLSQSTHANGATIGFSVNTTYRASNDALGLNTAATNVTWTANSSGLSINAAGYAGTATAVTGGATITLNSAGLSFNGTALAGTATALTGAIAATVNSAGVSISVPATSSLVGTSGHSVSTNGSTISIFPIARSSFQNLDGNINQTITLGGGSVSQAVAFFLPQNGSFSYLRLPVSMTTNSTTIATSAATRNVSGQANSTWNVVVYSLGTGANSRSLQSVASGSNAWTFMNSLSIAVNGTAYSVTQAFSANAEGAGTTRTTQYSISNTNYSLTTNQIATEWSGGRFIDVPLAAQLSAGPYWLVFGYSSSGATNSAGNWSNANAAYSNHYGQSGINQAFGVMGSTNLTSGGMLGVGSFSTAGGGTTNSIPLSAISSSASHVVPYFQLIRQA